MSHKISIESAREKYEWDVEYKDIMKKRYDKSVNLWATFFSNFAETGESYSEYIPFHRPSTSKRPNYVLVVKKSDFPKKDILCGKDMPKNLTLNEQIIFKHLVSGDDYAIQCKIPLSKIKEIYQFSVATNSWLRIK
jgi:hypothetical protein